jgi:L-serine dehydratase
MGPARAARIFRERNPRAASFRVELAGSLAATGRGHLTDTVIVSTLSSPVEIVWSPDLLLPTHPNGMRFWAFDPAGTELDFWEVYSIGGGALSTDADAPARPEPYPFSTMREALELCEEEGIPLWQLAFRHEGDIREYLTECWSVMSKAVARGLETEGSLPGSLKLVRKASSYIIRARRSSGVEKRISTIFAYALAVAEENAAGGIVVTAPTCGSCGVLPAVLRILMEDENLGEERIVRAMATAGLVGNIVKVNASISGAEVGCQGEIGTACAMAAAAAAQLLGATPRQIEYAAEMGLEHHLGLTCDPIDGLVQIPCIERNAMAASRALDCAIYALLSDGSHRVSFDMVVKTMYETGRDLRSDYRETSRGGLAIHC